MAIASLQTGNQACNAQVLDKQKQLEAQTFWDNRDWDWYKENIPFFECPDADITTTYYYRWELLTKHLTFGSPTSGYSFTEFIDRPFWSGAYGAISCPAGHQLYEARWLRKPAIARDYLRYWFRTPGAQPRNYSTWLADSAWALNLVHKDDAQLIDLLPDLVRNYEGWEQRHFVPSVGLFWQTGHDDGMEFNINSRQTKDILRGAPSYRPSFNAYMWADATAISKIALLAGKDDLAKTFEQKAAAIKSKMQDLLWDAQRQFFFPAFRDNEERDGHRVVALSRTYETGEFAGDLHGRELIGYVPWQFGMIDANQGYEVAWAKLMDRDAFFANYGPTTVERNDPMFLLKNSCCWWSGQSWPYATSQTLKAMANVLQKNQGNTSNEEKELPISSKDYSDLLRIFAQSHRKENKPYLAEALHPDTGSFEGHDAYNHSEHYFHSSFCDLVITGLVGLKEQADNTLIVSPLSPPEWDYFALDDVSYHGRQLTVIWDRLGNRYGYGIGLHAIIDGKKVASSLEMKSLKVELGATDRNAEQKSDMAPSRVNYAVNNDGDYYPRLNASFTAPGTAASKLHDGNYWYHVNPPNRWTTSGSPNATDWVEIDLGTPRICDTVKLYFLEDAESIKAPVSYQLDAWTGSEWQSIENQIRNPKTPTGHRSNTVVFDAKPLQKLRVTMAHAAGGRSGLTEIELWGLAELPYVSPRPPAGNIAFNSKGSGFPKATASYSDRFGGQPMKAIDGKIVFLPTPMNRWTSYESPNRSDWLDVDFGKAECVGRIELYIYDDRGGVQPPTAFAVQYFQDGNWLDVERLQTSPSKPVGGIMNTVRFQPLETTKLRVVFTNAGNARSGVTEIEVWRE